MWTEFKAFLLKQNILALALAVVLGQATSSLVQAVVNDFIMPLVAVIGPNPESWKQSTWGFGKLQFGIGDFGSVLLNFIIIGFVAWRITKLFIREPAAAAKPAVKECPFCIQTIDARAHRCPHCTSELVAVGAA